MALKLKNRVAVVTGASSGIGRAIAIALAEQGAAVVCSDIRKSANVDGYEPDLDVDTDDLIVRRGGRARHVQCDVTNAKEVKALVSSAVEQFGRLDVMVNNAGVAFDFATVVEEREEDFDITMAVNVKGVWLGCKYAIEQFLKQEPISSANGALVRGRIINMASIAGLVGLAKEPAYCASKAAVIGLTKEIAVDFAAQHINANAICPGFLATAMVRSALEDEETSKWLHGLTPWPRLGNAGDVAKTAVFLASDDAEWVTGSAMTVDGGFVAR
ncbi:SDR family NAD(P)-dependent oxidoreductase [Burkholderia multivorans]|uniref:SDR family NAD(P)-dependent oxidoreductase n=1 Tax=Burkholderia multivorans TaxID=87883 RepID=UPI0013DF85D2|nr:glucose 1-dehydrogenase [Burkholderia multivorans]NGM80787.1 glucose 1-dehydrogenase [Burkholderia multivorans]